MTYYSKSGSASDLAQVFIGFLKPTDSQVTMPNQTPADNVRQHIAVIMDGNRRFGGDSAVGLGLIDLPAARQAHHPSC
jgi:hypothetical protein